MTLEKCFDEFICRLSSVLSEERRTNDAEKHVYTRTRSKILSADAEHPFAFISLRWLFKPRLSTQWYTASYPYTGRIQYHLYSRPRVSLWITMFIIHRVDELASCGRLNKGASILDSATRTHPTTGGASSR